MGRRDSDDDGASEVCNSLASSLVQFKYLCRFLRCSVLICECSVEIFDLSTFSKSQKSTRAPHYGIHARQYFDECRNIRRAGECPGTRQKESKRVKLENQENWNGKRAWKVDKKGYIIVLHKTTSAISIGTTSTHTRNSLSQPPSPRPSLQDIQFWSVVNTVELPLAFCGATSTVQNRSDARCDRKAAQRPRPEQQNAEIRSRRLNRPARSNTH